MDGRAERYVENYVINKKTMALLPVILGEKNVITRVIEVEDSFFMFQKPLDIVERSCRKHGSSFLGRKEGTKELTRITHKAPIAISPTDQLYFFPTYSYSRKECAWLSHFHIASNKELADGNLIIRFINGFAVKLEMSKSSFENQQNRTAKLRTEYEDRKDKQGNLQFKPVAKEAISTLRPAYEKVYLVKEEDIEGE
ncbi:competence protein ComK [Bacillus cytotoxicus]|uniref:Competence transcription factor n=2 Tax=Bacillus cytotoxicus TaxID=580165 RepID=A0AAX2CF44_9BACI|nr:MULTISPECIES: competence protein ComK [Bacillus cereus group]ABS21191.1 ComK family protein [Bacillus cytotoxicus NVH 391-98]AWC27838.1 competence protein [Bacillus cytotoxicus]AWC40782.1 competence protein [Bacillus cytotoxicus]AWC43918.1 competence protein [Bacillus cytotoxicus]AWC48713.1 competence protein [Bacillus cytotoxicus]